MDELLAKLLAVAFSLLILWQAWVVKRVVGTWLFPACFFGLFWFLFTFLPLLTLWWIPVDPLPIAYILISCVLFSVGALPYDWRKIYDVYAKYSGCVKRNDFCIYGSWLIKSAFLASAFGAIVCLIANALFQGFTITDLLFRFLESSARYAVMRYSEEIQSNIFGQLSILLTYLAVTLGGMLIAASSGTKRRAWIIWWSFTPSVLVMLAQSAKGLFLLSIGMFLGAMWVVRIRQGEVLLFSHTAIMRSSKWIVLVIPLIVLSFMSRGLYSSDDTAFIVSQLARYFASYTCGHLYAFSDWFGAYIGENSMQSYVDQVGNYGFYTFMSVFKLFGSEKVTPMGTYDEYFEYGSILITNIYTAYRGLILDFGLIGSLIFSLISSVVFHLGFACLLTSKRPTFSLAMFVYMIAYIYNSFLISSLMWNSIYAGFLLLWGLLYVNECLGRSRLVAINKSSGLAFGR